MSDPYRPVSRGRTGPPARGLLPEARLIRLGASEPVLDAMRAAWAGMGAEQREWEAAGLAVMADDELAGWVDALTPPSGNASAVVSWAQSHELRALATAAALAAERARPVPRRTVLSTLAD